MKRWIAFYFVAVIVVLGWATITASLDRNLWEAGGELMEHPWFHATLIDTYGAFFTVWLFIAYREKSVLARIGWLVAIVFTGNFAIAAYFLLALRELGPDESWHGIFQRRESRKARA